MNIKNKIIVILVILLTILIVTCVVTFRKTKESSYHEQIKELAENMISDIW